MTRVTATVCSGLLAGLCGCSYWSVESAIDLGDPTVVPPTWPMRGGPVGRSFQGAPLPLATAPKLAWRHKSRLFAPAVVVVGNESRLFLWETGLESDHSRAKDKYFLIAVDLDDGREIWSQESRDLSSPTVRRIVLRSDRIFLAVDSGLIALDAATGQRVWRWEDKSERQRYPRSLAADEKRLYLSLNDDSVLAFRQDDAREVWKAHYPQTIISDTLCRGALLGRLEPAGLVSLSTGKGQVLWSTSLPPGGGLGGDRLSSYVSTLAVSGNMALATVHAEEKIRLLGPPRSSYLAAVNAENGAILGKLPLPSRGARTIATDGGRIYVGTWDAEVLCFSQRTGRRLWRTKPPQPKLEGHPDVVGRPRIQNLVISDKTAIVTTRHGDLFGLSTRTGKILWRIAGVADPIGEILIAGRYLILAGSRGVLAFEPVVSSKTRVPITRLGRDAQPTTKAATKSKSRPKDKLVHTRPATDPTKLGAGTKPAVPAMIRLLKDKDESVRAKAAVALGNMGPEAKEAIPALIQALADKSDPVRWRVREALRKIGRAAVPALARALKDDYEVLRSEAALALAAMGPAAKDAIPALIEGLKGKDYGLQSSCSDALGNIGPAAAPAVIDVFKDKRVHISARCHAATALAVIKPAPKAAVPVLVEALKEKDFLLRLAAVTGLGGMGPAAEEALPALKNALRDKSPEVRILIARVVARIGPSSVSVLLQAMKDKHWRVRCAAIEGLSRIDPEAKDVRAITDALRKGLKDKNEDVRDAAADTLKEMGEREKQ